MTAIRRIVRGLTALAVAGVCLPVLIWSWGIVRFAAADAGVGATQNRSAALRAWSDVPGVGFAAREAALPDGSDLGDQTKVRARERGLSDMLFRRPLSPAIWLNLSEMRHVAGEPSNRVTEALRMSVLSGANEGYVMSQRGIFGLSLWEAATPEFKSRTITDLTASLARLSQEQRSYVRVILAGKPASDRGDIRAELIAAGAPADLLQNIGL